MGELRTSALFARTTFDALKGIGILEVVAHHCLSQNARKYADLHDSTWWTLRIANRILHFAIPLFLLVSALLLTRSLLKSPDWGRFVRRRATRTLWPYVLWSLFYWAFRLLVLKVGSDVYVVDRTYPIIGDISGPQLLVNLPSLFFELLWGKAYFHLYFMVVLLQLALVLPFVILAIKHPKVTFARAVTGAVLAQLACFFIQGFILRMPTPGSMIVWYVPSVTLGAWIGAHPEVWLDRWPKLAKPIAAFGVAGLALYLGMTYRIETNQPVNSIQFNSAFSLYACSVALLLVGFAPRFGTTKIGEWVGRIGRFSLPIFLVHPAIMYFLGGPKISALIGRFPIPVVLTIALTLAISYAFALVAVRLKLDGPLFGQALPRPAAKQPA